MSAGERALATVREAVATVPAATPGPHGRRFWLFATGVVLFGFAAYANTLGHGFVWDDPIWLEQKIRFYRGPMDAFFEPTFMPMRQVYRPLSQLTYWLDQALWWRNPFGFHLTSVMLHAANGALVLALACALGFELVPATGAALLFLVHPIQPESVAWITNRVDELTTLFAIVAVLAALRPPSLATLAIVALGSFGAAASKETGCVVPALVLATSLVRVPTADAGSDANKARRPPWIAFLVSVGAVLPYFALRPSDATTGIPFESLGGDALGKLVGSVGYQVERLFFPVGFWPYLARVPTDPRTLALAAIGASAAITGLLLPDPSGRRRFAVLWILAGAALPVLVAFADFSSTPVAEHRLYLAVVGLALLVAGGLDAWSTEPRARGALIALAIVALTAVTVLRNRPWHDELTLWTAVTDRLQTESLPYLNLGLALAEAKHPIEAEAAYRRALALDPPDVTRQRTSIDLGLILVDRGNLDEADQLFTAANAIGRHAIALRGLGMVARKRAQIALRASDTATATAELNRAHGFLREALAINPRYYQAALTLAGVFYDAGQYRAAIAQYQRVAELAGDTEAGKQAASAAQQLGVWLAAHPEVP